jgi:hypothetical protein
MNFSLDDSIKALIANHYEGNRKIDYELGLAILKDIDNEDPIARHFFMVPGQYRYTYRILANVPKENMFQIIEQKPKEKGKIYLKKLDNTVSSWTVDRESFHSGMIGIDGIGKYPMEGRYTIMLETRVGKSFIFNPNKLPEEVGASSFEYEYEIVAIGNLEDVSVSYVKNKKNDSYESILEKLEDM